MLDQAPPATRPASSVGGVRTLPEMFMKRVELTPSAAAWMRKRDGRWVTSTWHDFHAVATALATALLDRGLALADKISIVGSTRPEWCIADIAGMLAGAVTVGAYPTLTADQLFYILDHSDSKVVFVEDGEQLAKVLEAKSRLAKLELVVVWDTTGLERELSQHDFVVSFESMLRVESEPARIAQRIARIDPKQTAIIVYTSGTTGPPKGAMISHENILTMLGGATIVEFDESDVGLVFLPMAHVAERVLSFYGRIYHGTCAAYASSVPAVLNELGEVKPTLFGSVPRIFEKSYARIQSEVDRAPAAKQKVFRWAESVGHRVVQHWQAGRTAPFGLKLQYRVADKLVFEKLRAIFGGRVKYFVTGAAPIPRRILEFFWAAGLPVYELYGMTEATAVTHANGPGATRLGSVGKAFDFVEDRLADDGEVLIRGKTVFQGYYKDAQATAEAIDAEGWLHTGDIGKKDANGYLYIVDRKKHIIITAGGKNLTPSNIENEIKTQDPIISHVHAHGDRRPYVTALVTINPLDAVELAKERALIDDPAKAETLRLALLENPLARPEGLGELMQKVTELPELKSRIIQAAQRGNAKLSRVEQVKRIYLLDRELSLDEDEVTPTLKVKRKTVEQKFARVFDQLYEDESFGIVVSVSREA